MGVAAVITEYNPFHLGHEYQLRSIKEQSNADCLIVIMSGNVVQRGEFAVLDKWSRSQAAIQSGADLVLELPLIASLQSADFFAYWSIKILDALEIDDLYFGTESMSTEDLMDYVTWLETHQDMVEEELKIFLDQGYSYAASYQSAVEKIGGAQYSMMGQANHLLAIQYIQSLRKLSSNINFHAIKRIKQINSDLTVYSGSQLRDLYKDGRLEETMLPPFVFESLRRMTPIDNSDYFDYLRYQILSQSPSRLKQYFGIDNGMETYIYQATLESTNYENLIDNLTSKRWTKAAIQRKLMALLLNITKEEWTESIEANNNQLAVRILAYTQSGKDYLKKNRDNSSINMFSNLRQNIMEQYALNLRADTVYSKFNPNVKIMEQNTGRFPIQQ